MFRFEESIDSFHARARDARRLEDFGADDYTDALRTLCRSLDEDAKLTPIGEFALQGMITDALEARLLVEQGWKDAPEAAEHRIDKPIVIIGLPRSGTTALHHLMAQDPAIQSLEHWLQRTPKPRPPRADWEQDADYRAAADRIEAIFDRSPDMRAMHEIGADLPDECWNLFAQNFSHSSYQANADVAQYASWWAHCDMTPAYRRHLRNAQLIGHREPEKRWLFKDATHLFDPDSLFEVYPDALIVQTHREPAELIPSVCSLCWTTRSDLNEGTDPKAFGSSTLDLWHRSIENMMKSRAKHDPSQFFDLSFERFVRDPIAAIEMIYAAFDLDFTPAARESMQRFRTENPKGKHGSHRYDASQWGLEPERIRERFRSYTERFDFEAMGA